MKTLAGDWTGEGHHGMATPVNYKVSANGTVVMETLFAGTPHEMLTLYYLAGNDLVATHYCAGANQPHFKLDTAKSTPDDLVFAFDGGTNLDTATKATCTAPGSLSRRTATSTASGRSTPGGRRRGRTSFIWRG